VRLFGFRRMSRGVCVGEGDGAEDDLPHTPEPALNTDNLLLVPIQHLADGRLEQHVRARGVGAVLADTVGRVDAVVFALAHLLPADGGGFSGFPDGRAAAVAQIDFVRFQEAAGGGVGVGFAVHHALGDEFAEGFAFVGGAAAGWPEGGCGEEFGDEARVEEVEDGVLDAADVDVDWEVSFGGRWVERSVSGLVVLKADGVGLLTRLHCEDRRNGHNTMTNLQRYP